MILRSNLIGTKDMVAERIRVYRDAGVTTLRLYPVGNSMDEQLEVLDQAVSLVKENAQAN